MPAFDDEEKELLESKGIPLTDPTTTTDVDETHKEPDATPEATETPAADADAGGDAAGDAGGDGGADGDGDVPAATADATAAAGANGAGDGDGAGKPGKPADAAPASVIPPATPEPTAAAKRLAEVEALILSDDHDPYSADGKKLQLEHNRLSAEVVAEPLLAKQREEEAYKPYTQQYPDIPQADMQTVFKKHAKAYGAKGYAGDALTAAATVAMEFELAQIANGKKGAAAAAAKGGKPGAKVAPPVVKPPITTKGAIVAPPATVPVAAPRRELTDEEELVENMRKMHPAGMRRTLRG